jgi:hypothetical protein
MYIKVMVSWCGQCRPGVDVMITIFGDFCQFSAKKLAFFSKTNVMIKILHILAWFWVKNANFFAEFFGENILKIITSVPDGANFRSMGDCFHTHGRVFLNVIISPKFWATFFVSIDYLFILTILGLGYNLGDFVNKLIWSPCFCFSCCLGDAVDFCDCSFIGFQIQKIETFSKTTWTQPTEWYYVPIGNK